MHNGEKLNTFPLRSEKMYECQYSHFNIKLEILANKTGKKEKEGKRRIFGGERGGECELVNGIPIRKKFKCLYLRMT